MASFNSISCTNNLGNTGYGECILIPKNIKGAIIVPKSKRYNKSNLGTLKALLQSNAQAASKADRIFPIHNFDGITDSTEDDVYQTTGYGDQNFSREGKYDWVFTYSEGGTCLHSALRTFPVKGVYVIFYDADNVLYGWDVEGEMAGIPLSIFKAQKIKINNGSNATEFMLKVMFDARYLNEESIFFKADFLISEVEGLKDVELYEAAAQTVPATFQIGARLKCSKTNIFELYSSELASTALWTAKNPVGASITITSVTANTVLECFTIVLDDEDADYPAPGASVTFDLVSPSALAAEFIENIEAISTTSATLD